VNERQVARLIADLDSDQFRMRDAATKELQQLDDLAEPALRKALEAKNSLETNRRLSLLLDQLRTRPFSPQQLQRYRALEALENLATPEARQVLTVLAAGAPAAMQTKEAKASLERLGKR